MNRMPRTARNVVPDRLDLRDRPYEPAITKAPPASLDSLDGSLYADLAPLHQGETSACTGFSLARVIDYLLIRAGRGTEAPVSPFMLYSMARRYDEFPGFTADEGSSLRGALKGWHKHGACSGALWPALRMPKPAGRPRRRLVAGRGPSPPGRVLPGRLPVGDRHARRPHRSGDPLRERRLPRGLGRGLRSPPAGQEPFVVNVQNNGELSDQGEFRTQRSDLEALVTIHLDTARRRWGLLPGAPLDLAVYAHGGLTSESAAAETASKWIPALYEAQVLPVFLMWETDLWSTLKNRLGDLVGGFAGQPERPTAGLRDQVQRFWNRRVERTLSAPGSLVWDEMKQNAEAIAANPRSGLRLVYKAGTAHGTLRPGNVRLHLIGHSAGAIVLSHAAKALVDEGWDIATVSFMAPAVRCDVYERTVEPSLGKGVARFHQYHLSDAAEQRDTTCRPLLLYGRSLLYLVSTSFEHGVETPILGMENSFARYRGKAGVHENLSPGSRAGSSTHGGFDDDELTRRSVIAAIVQSRQLGAASRAVVGRSARRAGVRVAARGRG
jgi:hypothetical protein